MTMTDDDLAYDTTVTPFHENGHHDVAWNVQPVVFETLRQFLDRDLPKAEALIGATRDGTNLLPRYGWVLPWGREGSGKTSVLVDMLFHAAAGRDWLGYTIPRPIRIVAIINEGVPGGLQDKLRQKIEVWDGDTDQVKDNLAIYASPWGEFTFSDYRMREHARAYALDFQADYVAADPLHTLGTIGAGAPQETEAFKHTLRTFGLWQDLGVLTAHHSNKNGMVSGDWSRHADTVIHLEKDGKNPATKFTLEKARPADPEELHVPVLLAWVTENFGYRKIAIDGLVRLSDQDILAGIYKVLDEAAAPLTMTQLRESVIGEDSRIGDLVKAEIAAGRITNHSTRQNAYKLSRGAETASLRTEPQTSLLEQPPHDSALASADPADYDATAPLVPMDTDTAPCAPAPQTSADSPEPPEGRLQSAHSPSPERGEEKQTQTDGPDPEPGYLAFLHTIEPPASDDIDWSPS